MPVGVVLKSLPESVEDATLMSWSKNPGDAVIREEKLAEIETDKVVLEITAETDGVLSKVFKNVGDIIVAGDLLAEIEPGEAGAAAPVAEPEPATEKADAPSAASKGDMSRFSPAARKIAEDAGLVADQIEGSGRDGRVTKGDVLSFLEAKKAAPAEPVKAPVSAPSSPAAPKPPQAPVSMSGNRAEKRVPMSRLRTRVAERLIAVQQTTAMLTTFNEVNMQSVMDLRARYKDSFIKEHGVKLGFMSFFVKAALEALKKYPDINASLDGHDIVYHDYFDIGIAMSTARGLMVPILRDADGMSFAGIEQAIVDVAGRAKENQIEIEELKGGTFTITNGGIFGSMLSTPILNPPQSAILGMHKIDQRPMAEDGQVVIRPMMYLALSYDHRIVDGKEAVSFLVAIKELIEEPSRLLLNL